MRTTLTLDDDVAAQIARLRKEQRRGLREVINDALRRGLQQVATPTARRRIFRTPTVDLGRCLLPNVDDVAETLAVAEGDAFR